jgi:hypothetical protein
MKTVVKFERTLYNDKKEILSHNLSENNLVGLEHELWEIIDDFRRFFLACGYQSETIAEYFSEMGKAIINKEV